MIISSRKGLAASFVAAFAFAAALGSGAASAGIANTKHNLGNTNIDKTNNTYTASTEEICVFCHTPHGATGGTNKPPLWNKNLPAAGSYTTYSTAVSSTLDAEVLTVGSVSIACLSCHDGSQAMDNMINAPGSGGYNALGASAGYTWTNAGASGTMRGGVANLSTDLSNDHPIGVAYCAWSSQGGSISNTFAVACGDPDFKNNATNNAAPTVNTASINSARVWWVDTAVGSHSVREKTDLILYTRTFAGTNLGTGGVGPSVECGTCHDPHLEDSGARTTFLRIANTGSAVCLACHVK